MHFDRIPDRSSSYSFKWEKYKGTDILPCWIADTEFRCAEPILDALKQRAEDGLLGYTLPKHHTGALDAIVNWCATQYQWEIQPSWVVWTPGVVPAFNMAIKAFAQQAGGVIVQTPNYPPLLAAPKINGCNPLCVPSVFEAGRWTLDFDALESFASRSDTSLFIMCNPMNPAGSVMNEAELNQVAEICAKHDVLLCSDEIHCDLILDDVKHIPASKHPLLASRSITLMAASKTFNVAGLGTSFAIIPDTKLRNAFVNAAAGIVPWVNVMGLEATETAFTQCDEWHQQQLQYLRENRDYLVHRINNISGLECHAPEATFLLWVDASGLEVDDTQKWCEQRGVGPSPGKDFAAPHFFRINYGCPRSYLETIVDRLSSK